MAGPGHAHPIGAHVADGRVECVAANEQLRRFWKPLIAFGTRHRTLRRRVARRRTRRSLARSRR